MKIVIVSILFVLVPIIIAAREKGNPIRQFVESQRRPKVTAAQFVQKINSLGYFKYAKASDIDRLKQDHLEGFHVDGSWGGTWDNKSGFPLDFRYFHCDGEYVYEQGGFTGMLEEMSPTFKKLGLELKLEKCWKK